MIVVRAETVGVCMGVRRALGIVDQALADNPGVPISTLGPLIHNPRVVEEYSARGVVPVDDPSQVREGIVVALAHGIGPAQREECGRRGLRLIDASCPHVLRIQQTVQDYSKRGFHVLIVGDEHHAEVAGIRAYTTASTVISQEEEAHTVKVPERCIVVSQTTFRQAEYDRICAILRRANPGIMVFDTSCSATEKRQEALLALASKVDALLVIGGKQSANTRWLYQAALTTGKPSWHIEGPEEIPLEITRYARVGVSAGASTPDAIIEEVEKRLTEL